MISRDVLEDIIEGYAEDIEKEKVIHRNITDDIERTLKNEEVTVIKGVRRSGKTFTLFELNKKHGGVYINFEDERLYDFSLEDFERVMDIIKSRQAQHLYLDEVQEVMGWEKFAHRAHRKVKIFVTGSNSKLLASEFSKTLVGRTKSFSMYPLSYPEFLRFRKLKPERNSLMEYMRLGGFPRIVLTEDLSLSREYLDRIVYRDILGKEKLMYPEALKTLALYLLSNVGKEFSYRSLKTITKIKHESTIKEYIGLLKEAFLLDVVNRYHPSLKIQESYGKKVYAIDPSFISLGMRASEDHGRILENVTYLHLKRRFEDVFIGKNEKEVDFILCDGLKPLKCVNVSYDVTDKATLDREISSLMHFHESLKVPCELISMYPASLPDKIRSHLAHKYLMIY